MAQGIRKKIDSRRAVGRDADGNGVGADDTVLVLKGTMGRKRSRTQNGGSPGICKSGNENRNYG